MKRLFWQVVIFFQLWRTDYYGTPIDAAFAWELAGIFEEHADALEDFVPVEEWEAQP